MSLLNPTTISCAMVILLLSVVCLLIDREPFGHECDFCPALLETTMCNTSIECSQLHGCSPDGLELRYLALSGSVNGPFHVGGTAPDLGCDHDPGDAAREYGNANQRSDGPNRRRGPLREHQYAQKQAGYGVKQEPSPSFNRSHLKSRCGCHSRVDQEQWSPKSSKRYHACNREEGKRDTAESIE